MGESFPASRVLQPYLYLNSHDIRAISYGNKVFLQHGDSAPAEYAFSVRKNVTAKTLKITVHTWFLRRILNLGEPYVLNLLDLVPMYDRLNNLLECRCMGVGPRAWGVGSTDRYIQRCAELELLAEHLLCDRDVFKGFDLKQLYGQGIMSHIHWQKVQHSSTLRDLEVIDNDFRKHCAGTGNASSMENSSCLQETTSKPAYSSPFHSHIFEAIQSDFDKLPLWSDNWRSPTNIVTCLKWCLGYYNNVQGESLRTVCFLDDVARWEFSSRIESLFTCANQDHATNASRLNACINIFNDLEERQRDWMGVLPSLAPDSVRRVSNAEKKDLIMSNVNETFIAEDQNFKEGVMKMNLPQHMTPCANPCRFVYQWYYEAWDKGMAAIRRFLLGKRPKTLERICRLLQVAYSMGSQDSSNQDFQTTFREDLDRWRLIVPRDSLSWFDLFAKAVWNKTFEDVPREGVSREDLHALQQLLSALISHYPLVDHLERDELEDDQVSQYEPSFEGEIDIIHEGLRKEFDEIRDPRAFADLRELPIDWRPTDPIIVLMMAGAIFGFIFSFLLSRCAFLVKS